MARGLKGAKEALEWYRPIMGRQLRRDFAVIAVCATLTMVVAAVAAAVF